MHTKSVHNISISQHSVAWLWCNLVTNEKGTLLYIHKQTLFSEVTHPSVKCYWENLCIVSPSHSQWLNKEILYISLKYYIIQVFCHSPYNQNLSHSDIWLFQKLKCCWNAFDNNGIKQLMEILKGICRLFWKIEREKLSRGILWRKLKYHFPRQAIFSLILTGKIFSGHTCFAFFFLLWSLSI